MKETMTVTAVRQAFQIYNELPLNAKQDAARLACEMSLAQMSLIVEMVSDEYQFRDTMLRAISIASRVCERNGFGP